MSIYFHAVAAILMTIWVVRSLKQRNITPSEYAVSRRDLNVFSLSATLVMTEFNTATFIAFSSLGYVAGLQALYLPLVFLVGLIFYALIAAKKWKEFNGISVADFFFAKYGKSVGVISSIFLFFSMAGFSATYLKSITLLISEAISESNAWVISAYISIATLILVIKKGLGSIVKMDKLSFLIIIIFLPTVLYFTSEIIAENNNVITTITLDDKFLLSLFPLTMFSYILAPWYGQRIFAAASKRVAKNSVLIASILVFILYSFGILISYTLAIKGIYLNDPQNAIPFAIRNSVNDQFLMLAYTILFLISSTTLTGVWNSMANIAMEAKKHKSTNSYIAITVLCALFTYFLSNTLVDNILNKMILANIPVISLSFALLSGFYNKRPSKLSAYVSIITGLIVGIGSYLYYGESGIYTYYWAFLGIPAIFISGCIGNLLSLMVSNIGTTHYRKECGS